MWGQTVNIYILYIHLHKISPVCKGQKWKINSMKDWTARHRCA